MNVITRMTFDNVRTKALQRFSTDNLSFSEYPIYRGWKLEIRLTVMDAGEIFDTDHGEVIVMDDGLTKLKHRQVGEFNTVDELLDVLENRLAETYKDYQEYRRKEISEALEAL